MKPVVSVVCPVRNVRRQFENLGESIASCHPSVEWIIIDGMSEDGTWQEVAAAARYGNLKAVQQEPRGVYAAMNRGVQLAKGQWLFFMGADDFLEGSFWKDPAPVLSAAEGGEVLEAPTSVLLPRGKTRMHGVHGPAFLANRVPAWNPWCHQGILTRRELLRNRPFDETFRFAADYEWLLWASEYLRWRRLPGPLAGHRIGTGISTQSRHARAVHAEWRRARKQHGVKASLTSAARVRLSGIKETSRAVLHGPRAGEPLE